MRRENYLAREEHPNKINLTPNTETFEDIHTSLVVFALLGCFLGDWINGSACKKKEKRKKKKKFPSFVISRCVFFGKQREKD